MSYLRRFLSFLLLNALVYSLIASFSISANVIKNIRVWPAPDETRVVMDMGDEAHYTYFTLSHPTRLVVDVQDTNIKAKLPISVAKSPVLKRIRRSSPPQKGTYRLVFELKKKVPVEIFKLPPTPGGEYSHRLVVDISHDDTPDSGKANASATGPIQSVSGAASNPVTATRDASQFFGTADIVVAVDAGHGGEDPGSIGPGHHYEKTVTLSIAKKLAAQINAIPGMKAVLTRRGDYFVSLNKRSEIARKNKAHLLVSIHADAFRSPKPRGASVFVLNTRRANTEISKWVEDHERQSELLGGAGQVLAKNNSDKNVSQTLLDLQFSHSQKEGYKLAKDILLQLGKVAYLHKKYPVNASLAVLKSPDIPSVLVETGFISNPQEEKLLLQRTHQDKLAKALAKATMQYFEANPPEGTLFANRKKVQKYQVHSGDSLSIIASRFGVSVHRLKQANKLKSNMVRIGQVLLIPSGRQPISLPATTNSVQTDTVTHVVRPGEYLGAIAAKYKVPLNDIKKENNLKSNMLRVGQKLKITVTLKDQPIKKHKVKRGEYLSKIANQYHVSMTNLKKVNQLASDTLRVGQILVIPNR